MESVLSNKNDWEFLIDGDSRYLRPLSERREMLYFDISGGIDDWHDCMNDDFRLNSVYFDNETDPELVWQVGHELVSLFNGVSSIISTNYRIS